MKPEFNTHIAKLIEGFLEKSLTESEMAELLAEVESNAMIRQMFTQSVLCDLIFQEKSRIDNTAMIAMDSPSDITTDRLLNINELSLEELVQLQNAEKPISSINESYATDSHSKVNSSLGHQFLMFTKKCFLPTGHDLEESIAPVFTAICVLLTIVFAIIFLVEHSLQKEAVPRMTAMARVIEIIDPVWEKNAILYQKGQLVNESQFRLASGLIQIEMNNGTSLILEGPVDLTLTDAMKVFCAHGNVSASVPPTGHGFEIATPFGNIVDRGTEFFVNVSQEGTQVEVTRGKVDYFSSVNEAISFVTNEVVKIDPTRNIQRFVPRLKIGYVPLPAFRHKAEEQAKVQREQYAAEVEKINAIPNLLLRFDATDRHNDSIANAAPDSPVSATSLIINQCEKTEGSIYGTEGIDFVSPRSLAHFDLPGQYKSLTLNVRMKLESWNNQSSTIFMSESYPQRPGTFFWQIQKSGEIAVFIVSADGKKESFLSQPCLSNHALGVWFSMRIVLNGENKTISFYLADRFISSVPWPNPVPLCIERGFLGNALKTKMNNSTRYFAGAMEQFYVIGKKTMQ